MKHSRAYFNFLILIPAVIISFIFLMSCSDVVLDSDRKPTNFQPSSTVTVIGGDFKLGVNLVDQDGVPFIRVPGWVDTTYTPIAGNILKVTNNGGDVDVIQPGMTKLGVEIGGVSEKIGVRVVPHLYFTQGVQRLNRSLRLVADQTAIVRLFLEGEEIAAAQDGVTLEFYQNGTLVNTIDYPTQQVTLNQISKTVSVLNLPVAGSLVQPGISVKVNTGEITYPTSDTSSTLDVTPVPEFHIRLIPIHSAVSGKTGEVNSGNVQQYLEDVRDMFPFNENKIKIDLHSPVTVNPEGSSQRAFYNTALNVIYAVRISEGTPDYYYYGVIPQARRGIVGLGALDFPDEEVRERVAVGWDGAGRNILPGAPETLAHELGHNFGRFHAPCGGVGKPDPDYPYPNASIGTYGFEVDESQLKSPLDYKSFMSYCSPTWISDYTYNALLKFHLAVNNASNNAAQSKDVLLVWGRMNNGKLILEPAFKISAPPAMPQNNGPFTLSGYDTSGNQLFYMSFSGTRVSQGNSRQFAFTIPVNSVNLENLETIRLEGRGLQAMQRANVWAQLSPLKMQAVPNVAIRKSGEQSVTLDWNSSRYKMALVKNPKTGEVLGFTNGGISEIKTDAQQLKLYFSDGVHTTVKEVSIN